VDGFSKVVANVVPIKRAVIARIQLKNNQIIDGYWAGELVDTSTITNMSYMFQGCSQLQNLDVSNWDVSSVTTMSGMFQGCDALKVLDLRNWDVSNCTNLSSAFDCKNLESLVGGTTIEEVLEQNICALKGMRVNCLLKTNNLDRASFRAVINGLADLTGQASCSLALNKYHRDRFTQEDIDLATSKNWTLAWG
jgi:surface protein